MKHLSVIGELFSSLITTDRVHLLLVQSAPGLGKSTLVSEVVTRSGCQHASLGAYTTPLALYNFLYDHRDKIVIVDDTSGALTDRRTLDIFKAASWPSAGNGQSRVIAWTSSSKLVKAPRFEFSGKIVLLTNAVPETPDVEALASRSFRYAIYTSPQDRMALLQDARAYYADDGLAQEVIGFIQSNRAKFGIDALNYRTIQLGLALARSNPKGWQELLIAVLPKPRPIEFARKLNSELMTVRAQEREFMRVTGMSRRTFYNYRKQLRLV